MRLANKLELLIDEYLSENDKKNIQLISIAIPRYSGYFFILDSFKINLKASKIFSLSIFFSFNPTTKYGKSLIDKISKSGCFNDFIIRGDGKNTGYFKEFYDNKKDIVENVERIIDRLFPQIEINSIDVELKRITNWLTIE